MFAHLGRRGTQPRAAVPQAGTRPLFGISACRADPAVAVICPHSGQVSCLNGHAGPSSSASPYRIARWAKSARTVGGRYGRSDRAGRARPWVLVPLPALWIADRPGSGVSRCAIWPDHDGRVTAGSSSYLGATGYSPRFGPCRVDERPAVTVPESRHQRCRPGDWQPPRGPAFRAQLVKPVTGEAK
jgi:hypothetical protein